MNWEELIIQQGTPGINYKTTFKSEGKSYIFSVYPVYKGGGDSIEAINVYNSQLKRYNEKLGSRLREEQKRKTSLSGNGKNLKYKCGKKSKASLRKSL